MAEARAAATVIVLRPGTGSLPETLLLRRSGESGFFPHAWVFPGGRVDAADAHVPFKGSVVGLAEGERAFAVAAVRECLEEAGVWLGAGVPPPQLRAALNQRQATLADAPGLTADLDRLKLWGWWCTPAFEPRRYDTRFFVAVVDRAEVATHDAHEAVASRWMTATGALEQQALGELFMAPPTFRTLEELARLGSLEAICAAPRSVACIEPRRIDVEGALVALELPPPGPGALISARRIVLRQGSWRSEA